MVREKSDFLSSFGIVFEIWKKIVNAVQDIGGTDDDLRGILTEDGLAQKLADVLMSSLQITGPFETKINYNRSLVELIEAGKYDGVDPEINDQNFPVVGNGEHEVKLFCVHFKKSCTTEEVLAYLVQHALQPAKIEHLLAVGETHGQAKRLLPKLIALGTSWIDSEGSRFFVGLQTLHEVCNLRLALNFSAWRKDCYFLAVREAA
ncbi:MAG: hypothetical protein PHC97_00850 [Patescibacteria group bacterium]|nr:hypothetical protein [Patescibacteria group bacterium]